MNADFVGKSVIHFKLTKSRLLKMFPMQIDWTGMEMNFVTLVYVSAIEVTGPSIVYLLPKHLLNSHPRWRKRLKHCIVKSRVLGSIPYRCLCFSDRMADELS